MTSRRLASLLILLAAPVLAGGFDRPSWKVQACRDARARVMAQQCASVTWDAKGCKPRQAVCKDVYEGAEISTDTPAQALAVDHVYPASVAWARGTWLRPDGTRCTSPKRTKTDPGCPAFLVFYNDPRNLLVVRARTNMQKSDQMPDRWCPATRGGRRVAAVRFRQTAKAYRLPILPAEEIGLRAWEAGTCVQQ